MITIKLKLLQNNYSMVIIEISEKFVKRWVNGICIHGSW